MVVRKNLKSNALISVYDKTNLNQICKSLDKYNQYDDMTVMYAEMKGQTRKLKLCPSIHASAWGSIVVFVV